jgi:hypothetical protein
VEGACGIVVGETTVRNVQFVWELLTGKLLPDMEMSVWGRVRPRIGQEGNYYGGTRRYPLDVPNGTLL